MFYMKPAFIAKPKDDIERFINAYLLDLLAPQSDEATCQVGFRANALQVMFATKRSYYFAHTIRDYVGKGSVGFLLPSFECVYVAENGDFYTANGKTEVKKGKRVYCLMEDKAYPEIVEWAKNFSNYSTYNEVPAETIMKNCEEAFQIPRGEFGFLFHTLSGTDRGGV